MNGAKHLTHKRVDITLPEDTIRLIDRVTEKGDRSRLINEAVRHYFEALSRENIRRKLKEGAIARTNRDLKLAREWFLFEEKTWLKSRG